MTDVPELTHAELDRFSIHRAVQAHLEGRPARSSVEGEYHKAVAKALPGTRQDAVNVPSELLTRALNTGVTAEGGALVLPKLGRLIDARRPTSVCLALGARFETMALPADLPRLETGTQARWVDEDPGSDVDDSAPRFSLLELRARGLTTSAIMTRQLHRQSAAEAHLRMDMARSLAGAIDKAGLVGTGQDSQPRGILHTVGIGSVTSGGTVTFGHVAELERLVAAADCDTGSLGFASSPGLRSKLRQTLRVVGGEAPIWGDDGILGLPSLVSTAVPGNDDSSPPVTNHALVYGDWSRLLVAISPASVLIVDPFRYKRQGLIEVTPYVMADAIVEDPGAFAAIVDASTS